MHALFILLCGTLTANGAFRSYRGDEAPIQQSSNPKQADTDQGESRLHKVLAEVSYDDEDLEDALADLAKDAGLNLIVDWPALEAIAIYGDTRIDLSLKNVSVATAFTSVLNVADQRRLGATYDLNDGVLKVTSSGAFDRNLEVRTYDAGSVLQAATQGLSHRAAGTPAGPWRPPLRIGSLRWRWQQRALGLPPHVGLAEAIQATIDPDSWECRGGPASLRLVGDKLVIRQTASNHLLIQRLLNDLSRSESGTALQP